MLILRLTPGKRWPAAAGFGAAGPFRHANAELSCKREPVFCNVVSKGDSITHKNFCL